MNRFYVLWRHRNHRRIIIIINRRKGNYVFMYVRLLTGLLKNY